LNYNGIIHIYFLKVFNPKNLITLLAVFINTAKKITNLIV